MNTFKVVWSSPSNIALIKYWGKFPGQLPANPSVSFTLSKSQTLMKFSLTPKTTDKTEISLDFFFEGNANEKFKNKITNYLENKRSRFPWIVDYNLTIESQNTFPHSSGIASSASSMSALNLCLLSLDEKIKGKKLLNADYLREASSLSREASGSAGRSVYPFMAAWGKNDFLDNSSDLYAILINKNEVHEKFHHYGDSIFIVDGHEKQVSSRAGHALMETHPFRESRYEQARKNFSRLLHALKTGVMEEFIEVVEEEALTLHALMMSSKPSFILLKPMSLLLIEKIRSFRENEKIPVCFTIDAGPNIHLLYPMIYRPMVLAWIAREFLDIDIIHDEVGSGPIDLSEDR